MFKNSIFRGASNDLALDYKSVLTNISNFRRSDGKTSTTKFDGPQTYYFKLFFYFDNENEGGPASDMVGLPKSNLLGLTYDGTIFDGLPWEDGFVHGTASNANRIPLNTALNYLLLNYEWDRAEKLTTFIRLLSEISCKYPWYFTTINGVENAISRKETMEQEFKIDDQRRSIQIKCLPDSVDNKIGKLLDLYRNIVYSQTMHKFILPANLRKFDMGIFIFSRPIKNLHRGTTKKDLNPTVDRIDWAAPYEETPGNFASFKPEFNNVEDVYKTSYKYIEFHNCEFDYNSSASAYTDLNNQDGNKQEYTINIFYDNALENRYDEWLLKNIGDYSLWDLNLNSSNISDIGEDEWWDNFFYNEWLMANRQYSKRKEREDLLTDKGNTEKNKNQAEKSGNMANENTEKVLNEPVWRRWKKEDVEKSKEDSKKGIYPVQPNKFWDPKLIQAPVPGTGAFTNAFNQLYRYAKRKYVNPEIKKLKKLVLGNFYTVQFKNTKGAVIDASKGNALGAINKTKKVINGWKQKS